VNYGIVTLKKIIRILKKPQHEKQLQLSEE